MNTSKLIFGIFAAFAMLLGLSAAAEASYFNDIYSNNQGYGNYDGYSQPYNYGHNNHYLPNQNIFITDNFNKQEADYSNSGAINSLFKAGQSVSNNDFFAQGFFNNNYGNFNQNGAISLNDGYAFTKEPCVTRKTKANFDGKGSDFKIKDEVCDGISGNFFKNNAYQNSINNNFGYNQANIGANVVQNTFDQKLNQEDSYSNMFSNKYHSLGQSTSFGKGTQIIFY